MNPNKSAGDRKEEDCKSLRQSMDDQPQENIEEQLENNEHLPVDKVINDMNNKPGNVDSENINRMLREVEHNKLSEVISSPSKMDQLVGAMFTGMKRVIHCISSNIIIDVIGEQLTCIAHSVVNESDTEKTQNTGDESSSTVTEMPLYRGNKNGGLPSNTTSIPIIDDIVDCSHLTVNENVINELNREVIEDVVSECISDAIANVMYDMVLDVNDSFNDENNKSEISESTSFSNLTNIVVQDIINELMNEDVETIVGEVVYEELEGVEEKSFHGSEIEQEVDSDNSDLRSEIDLDSEEEDIIITENPQVGQGDMPSYEVLGDQQFEANLLRIIAEEGNEDESTDDYDSDITNGGNESDDEDDVVINDGSGDEAVVEIDHVDEGADIEENEDITDETFDEINVEEEKINEEALEIDHVDEYADIEENVDITDETFDEINIEEEKINEEALELDHVDEYADIEENEDITDETFDEINIEEEKINEQALDVSKRVIIGVIEIESADDGMEMEKVNKDPVKEIYEIKENNDVVSNKSRCTTLFDDKIINGTEVSNDSIQSFDQDIAKNKDNNKNILNYEINFDDSSSENVADDSDTENDEQGIHGKSTINDIGSFNIKQNCNIVQGQVTKVDQESAEDKEYVINKSINYERFGLLPIGSSSNLEHGTNKADKHRNLNSENIECDNKRNSSINPVCLRKTEIARCTNYREIKIKTNPLASFKPSWKINTQTMNRKMTTTTPKNNNKTSEHISRSDTTKSQIKNKKRVFVDEEDEISNKIRKMDETEDNIYTNNTSNSRSCKKQKRVFVGEEGDIDNKRRKVEESEDNV